MRFSEAFLRQLRDRTSIAEYAGRKLVWDRAKTRPAAGDFWACCPFHQEKSPSFHVLDRKGIYKCFGCGEHGDVFTLAMKLEGLSFPETVSRMAELAGMELPQDEYEDRAASDQRKRLYQLVGRAAAQFADALEGRDGKDARAYLEGRGLDRDTWRRFGIGLAPGGWTWLIDKLSAEGFKLGEIVEAGLAREGDGRRPIDMFRNRLMFEIADSGGKAIAFGGRALDAADKAKYINSPETPLFHKGRTLYRLKEAREILAKSKGSGLVVAEGYLDVIAFERAGIGAVAPLGTALTEEQLQLLWRAGGEPVLCFDGDSAGQRAAERALDLALPQLGPGKTVRIAFLPPGEDPDDVYRRAGPQALAPLLAAALPASDALFAREQGRARIATPEGAAAFKDALRQASMRIADAETRKLYLSQLLARADAALRARQPARGEKGRKGGGRFEPPPTATAELRAIARAPPRTASAEYFLRAVVDYPGLFTGAAAWIDRLDCADPQVAAIRDGLVALSEADEEVPAAIDRAALAGHLQRSGREGAAARVLRWPKPRPAEPDGTGTIEAEWLALVAREVALPAIKEEMADLKRRADAGDEAAFARFQILGREARAIETRAREAKLEEPPDDLVA